MRHQAAAPLVDTETWITNLTQKVYIDLPTDLRVAHIRMQRTNAVCDLDDSSLACLDRPPCISRTRLSLRESVVLRKRVIQTKQLVSSNLERKKCN